MGVEVGFEMSIAMICHEMHWTYDEYMSNPDWLIQTLSIKLEEDSRNNKSSQSKK